MNFFTSVGHFLAGFTLLAASALPLGNGWSDNLTHRWDTVEPTRLLAITAEPLPVIDAPVPAVSTASAVLLDRDSRSALWEREARARRPMASLTKLMTAVVALDRAPPSLELTVQPRDLTGDPAESSMGLIAGAKLSLGELLHGLLIPSGNDAAQVIARGLGGEPATFVGWMNEKARALGLTDTHFDNATGLDGPTHYSTAHDLAVLADYALRYPKIQEITSLARYTARDRSGRAYPLVSTNQLVLSGEAQGIKTGRTPGAGECLIGLERVAGREILSVVLGSPDRFAETRSLFSWAREHVSWK